MSRGFAWYARRLARMTPAEVAWRAADRGRQEAWARRQVLPGTVLGPPPGLLGDRSFTTPLPPGTAALVSEPARRATVAAADQVLAGEWVVLGTPRPDIGDPDWFRDPVTGRRAPQDQLAFRIDHRDERETGNVKAVWELSRHHHLTVLAAAWWLTGDERYAEATARQLRSWWAANPFLSGVHWTSGIELGVRLISWAWVRRLLDGWSGVTGLFEDNPDALRQLRWHQEFLAAFRSRGSSANNHAVAEAAGRLVAACAFPWFAESTRWRAHAADELAGTLRDNTFPDGVNRELATDYHRFVAELGLVAAVEATGSGHPLGPETWALLGRSLDAAAAMTDATGGPPRQGDGDEGRALALDPPEDDPWGTMLALGAALVGPVGWWPGTRDSVLAAALGSLGGTVSLTGRPAVRPSSFADAGMTLLRTTPGTRPEVWCRCDGGPHGFLAIAAHAHADALSVELRHDGVDVLVDPGTYCYHGEPEWRDYFRSTLAHNTVEVDGASQSVSGGPFLWSRHAPTELVRSETDPTRRQVWTARHDGYERLRPRVRHERTVAMDAEGHALEIVDHLTGRGPSTVRLPLHLGPDVEVRLEGDHAFLEWVGPQGPAAARMWLDDRLDWSTHRGETDPVLGWYSPRFGIRVPTTTLLGAGVLRGGLVLRTTISFLRATPAAPATASAKQQTLADVASGGGAPRG